ncbi:tRNA (mnm(5)s(2)U34)-methyltransferase [Absicoccus porci]|uniref:16S rRNA (Cytosine(1402)-N(4))-methyltransferase n=2 Tax=Absicoccus porci TaxID=2486576 RepID=A0A3N0I025_9FIRM|nr:class I SAM-dependent methyltransferase [Absicoccus porci]RNM30373.1 16S rRNA (cytosine(1402)-N(4))-methyltransferase [Absicoccus porci]
MKSMVERSHDFLSKALHPQAICIDATLGNGKDTKYFLSQNVQKVYAFEIQEDVIAKTKKEIDDDRVFIYHIGHEHMDRIHEVVDAIIFNFGYCPHGKKEITTLPETSLEAVQKGMDLLRKKGRMALVFYHHSQAQQEQQAIESYLSCLTSCDVCKVQMMNHDAPYLIEIEKK